MCGNIHGMAFKLGVQGKETENGVTQGKLRRNHIFFSLAVFADHILAIQPSKKYVRFAVLGVGNGAFEGVLCWFAFFMSTFFKM